MAVYYFRNTGDTNWSVATNWSLTDGGGADGAVPTITDAVFLTANSGNCNIGSAASALSIDCTGYTNTLSGTAKLTLGSGNITFSTAMMLTATGDISVSVGGTINFNNKEWLGVFNFAAGAATYVLVTDITVASITTTGGGSKILNGAKFIYNKGGITIGAAIGGDCTLAFIGTGNWTNNNAISINTIINTTGVITTTGTNVTINNNLTIIAGTLDTTTNNTTINFNSTQILDLRGTVLNSASFGGTDITFISNFSSTRLTHSGTNNVVFSAPTSNIQVVVGIFTMDNTGGISMHPNIVFTVNQQFYVPSYNTGTAYLKSSVPGTKFKLVLTATTITAGYLIAQDIDATGNKTLWIWNGIITNCDNVRPYTDGLVMTSKAFAA